MEDEFLQALERKKTLLGDDNGMKMRCDMDSDTCVVSKLV